MGDRDRSDAVVVLEKRDLGGGGSGVDDQDVEQPVIVQRVVFLDRAFGQGLFLSHYKTPFLRRGNRLYCSLPVQAVKICPQETASC